MRRQINTDELTAFYTMIGGAIWHIQHLENVMVSFLAAKIAHERLCAGQKITDSTFQILLAEKRKLTLGPLIESCHSKKIVRSADQSRLKTFKLERHWLVHQSLIENGDDLYIDSTRDSIFNRIRAIEDDAIALRAVVFDDFQGWMIAHNVNVDAASKEADGRCAS